MDMVVAPGRPRWLGYTFYLATFLVATVWLWASSTLGDDIGGDLVRIVGVVACSAPRSAPGRSGAEARTSVKGLLDRLRRR